MPSQERRDTQALIARLFITGFLAAGILLGSGSPLPVHAENGEDDWSARLTRIQVQSSHGLPVVKITTSGRVASSISYLNNPDRLLLKVRDTLLTWKPATLTVNQDPILRIRSAQHDTDAWVVLDLAEPAKWNRETHASGITLRMRGAARTARSEPRAEPVRSQARVKPAPSRGQRPDQAVYQVVDVAAEDQGGKTRLTVTTDGQARYRVEREKNGKRLLVKLYGATLSWRASSLRQGAIRRVRVRQQQEAGEPLVRLTVDLVASTPYLVFKEQNQVVVEFNNPGTLERGGQRRGNINTRVSVDLQNADLGGVLRALAQDAGFDLVLTPATENLTGAQAQVTLSINQQPLRHVLDFILKPKQLSYVVSGNTLRIGLASKFPLETRVFTLKNLEVKESNIAASLESGFTEGAKGKVVVDDYGNRVIVTAIPSDLAAAAEVIRSMDRERQLVTRTFVLSYTQAAKIKPLLQSLLSSLGSIRENQGENSLVVSDIPGNLNQVARMVRSLDTKADQIMIEARIVEVSLKNQTDLGVSWNVLRTSPGANTQASVSSHPADVGAEGKLTIGTLQTGWDLNTTLSALESKGRVNIISNPRIATLNNQSVTLKASQNIPYQTSTISNGVVSNVVNYLELPITLIVTPRITKDRHVMLSPMTVTVTTVVKKGSPPTTSTRSATTQMLVADGETIAIGGMVRDEESVNESKFPLLGDIPLLGFLFRSTVAVKNKVELIVFLTPHILE